MFLNSILGFLSIGRKERNNALKNPSLKEEFYSPWKLNQDTMKRDEVLVSFLNII